MKKDKSAKGEATRLAIEDAAINLFMDQGYHATSMRQIADQAGLALGGIYNHFSSKEEIFAGIVIDKHPYKQILPLIVEIKAESAEEFIREAARILVTELGNRPDLLKLFFIELVEFNGKHVSKMLSEIVPKILPIFEQLVRVRKNLRKIPPPVLVRSFIGMFFSYYFTELLIKGSIVEQLTPKNSFDIFVDIYLHGVIKESA